MNGPLAPNRRRFSPEGTETGTLHGPNIIKGFEARLSVNNSVFEVTLGGAEFIDVCATIEQLTHQSLNARLGSLKNISQTHPFRSCRVRTDIHTFGRQHDDLHRSTRDSKTVTSTFDAEEVEIFKRCDGRLIVSIDNLLPTPGVFIEFVGSVDFLVRRI